MAPGRLPGRSRPRRPSCLSRLAASRWSSSGSKKKWERSPELLRSVIEAGHADLSVRRQCELLGLSRSSLYYQAAPETAVNLRLMQLIDQEYTAHPFLGSRRLTQWLIEQGEEVNRKRVQRLMRLMGLEAIYPKPRLSVAGRGHRRTSTCGDTRRCRSWSRGWGGTFRIATRRVGTRPWATGHPRRCIGRGAAKAGGRVDGRHSFSHRTPSAWGEGECGAKKNAKKESPE